MTEQTLEDGPRVSEEAILAAIRECIGVVRDGDILLIRLPVDIDHDTLDLLQRQADVILNQRHGVHAVFVAAEEFAIRRRVPDDEGAADGTG